MLDDAEHALGVRSRGPDVSCKYPELGFGVLWYSHSQRSAGRLEHNIQTGISIYLQHAASFERYTSVEYIARLPARRGDGQRSRRSSKDA